MFSVISTRALWMNDQREANFIPGGIAFLYTESSLTFMKTKQSKTKKKIKHYSLY